MRPTDHQIEAVVDDVRRLFIEGSGNTDDLEQLRRYARARPASAPLAQVLPADEADERLRIAGVFLDIERQETEEDANLMAMTLAIVAMVPLDQLQMVASSFPEQSISVFMTLLLQFCMSRDALVPSSWP